MRIDRIRQNHSGSGLNGINEGCMEHIAAAIATGVGTFVLSTSLHVPDVLIDVPRERIWT
jgi:hypothetical protein